MQSTANHPAKHRFPSDSRIEAVRNQISTWQGNQLGTVVGQCTSNILARSILSMKSLYHIRQFFEKSTSEPILISNFKGANQEKD